MEQNKLASYLLGASVGIIMVALAFRIGQTQPYLGFIVLLSGLALCTYIGWELTKPE